MPKIELKQAETSDHPLIVNLMQFYNYDFSEWIPLSFAEDGFFAIRPKLEYLSSPKTIPLLILVDDQIAGFVIVDDEVHVEGAQHNIGYFFVARRYRGLGVGTQVVSDLLGKFPGRWQIWHVKENLGAAAFWAKAVPLVSGGKYAVHSLRIDECNATLYRFDRCASSAVAIDFESPDQPDVIALIAELDAYQDTLYPPESRHSLDLASLERANVLFAVARDGTGRAIGCGGIVLGPEFGELKRMYVSPSGRGQGVARKLLALLESRAIGSGCQLLKLETGPYQHEALALYASAGYERRGPFGHYANDPLSVFMQKHIAG
ncbi:GNAT family N-acetyltransferase [Burkholderia sp. 4M9327F10]|uniref:GNAT family N-acetyltransferase n=1 Tax=Burkholderia sp. 4M9327F10 TaxID=2502223 RepID=UPI001BB20192